MNEVILCGHTGSQNRGCEAIIRSTTELINKCNVVDQVSAMSFDSEYDKHLALDKSVHLISYPKLNLYKRIKFFIQRKIFNNQIRSRYFFYEEIEKKFDENIVLFNVGGDTYCYDTPYLSYALTELAVRKGIPLIFWGCSVEKNSYTDLQMKNNINSYSFIVARESLSFEILKKCVTDEKKVYLACDPAFHLSMKAYELPKGFKRGETLGINLSPLVFSNYKDSDDIMYRNTKKIIDFVLENTEMNIFLIPHVYNLEKNTQDIFVLRMLKNMYQGNNRIGIVDQELSCRELKYLISQCRFFIGSRTHAMIAAYSTGIPALALSYSIKSRGIAKDIFGTEDGYAIDWKKIIGEKDLLSIFLSNIMRKEDEIKALYSEKMPEYMESIMKVTKKIIENNLYYEK